MIVALTSLLGWAGIVGVFLAFLYFRHKLNMERLETLVKLAEQGRDIDPEVLGSLGNNREPKTYKTDFKYGLLWLAFGIPLTFWRMLEDGVAEGMYGTIAIFLGIAYLISAKLRLREPVKSESE